MKIVKITSIFGLIMFVALMFSPPAFAEVKEIVCEASYNMGDGETPNIAEDRALIAAKKIAIEQAGTYVESYSQMQNYQLTKDEVNIIASGIMEVTILDKRRTIVGNGFNFWVKISAKVSTDSIKTMAEKLKNKHEATSPYNDDNEKTNSDKVDYDKEKQPVRHSNIDKHIKNMLEIKD
jgi:hypothetical protein